MVDYKKLCAALLSMALCFSAAAPVSSAFAEESGSVQGNAEAQVVESGNLSYYPLGDGKAVLVSIKSEGDTLDIPEKADDVAITEIDAKALDGVGASVINIPAGIEYISAENPFTRCENLTAVNVDGGNAEYCSVDGVLYNKDKTALLCCPAGLKGDSFTIPDSVTSVGVAALYDTQFRSISVPAGVTEIKRHAFSYCAELASIDLSGTAVEYIGDMAFASCDKLSDVKLPDTLTELGSGAFALCGKLTDITLPENLQAVGQSAFQGTGLSRIVVPASVEEIGYCAFGYDKDENPIEDFVIVGENGSAVINNWNYDGEIVKVSDWENRDAVPIQAGAGITKTMAPRTDETIKRYPLPRLNADWSEYYANIFDTLEGKATQIVTHDQQRRLLKLVDALFLSAKENRVVEFEK